MSGPETYQGGDRSCDAQLRPRTTPKVYAKDDNSAERGSHDAWQDMQNHEIRQRQRHEPSITMTLCHSRRRPDANLKRRRVMIRRY